MSTELKVVMRKIPQDSDEAFSLRYSLICDRTPEGMVYGVRVEKLSSPGGAGGKDPIEFETVHGLTYSAEQAAELVALLAENTVMPCVLTEMLDELPFTSEQKYQPNNQYFKQAYVAK